MKSIRRFGLVMFSWCIALWAPLSPTLAATETNFLRDISLPEPSQRLGGLAVGQPAEACEGCPVFVRVPDAAEPLRRIRYVAKYPLTWRQYLVAVKKKACPVPSLEINISGRIYSAETYLDELEIDWPISILNKSEIDCFKAWLTAKSGYVATLPTEKEWEWFALGDRTDSNFPWGNSTEDPPAAVKGVEIARENILTGIRDQAGVFLANGVRVGTFAPNSWGLNDLIGSGWELTSAVYTGREWYRLHPHPFNAGVMLDHDVVVVKGGFPGEDLSKIRSVYNSRSLRIIDGRFSSGISLRFVLIERDAVD